MAITASRATATAVVFAMGAICATSIGVATARPSHPSATAAVAKVKPVLVRRTVHVSAGTSSSQYAVCPTGDTAISGGAAWAGGGSSLKLIGDSGPVNKTDLPESTRSGARPVEWYATLVNNDSVKRTGYVWAECVA